MSKLSIKVVLAGRNYPLTVSEGEEVKIRAAAEEINKAIKVLQDNYAVKDMQDLLAMTALQLAAKGNLAKVSTDVDYTEVEAKLEELSKSIDR